MLTLVQKQYATSFLNGHCYTFGEFDVGSLDLGPQKNIGTGLHTGAFRSEGVSGNGYFARELLADISEFPHYLPIKEFKQRRDEMILTHAGNLVKLPKEIRIMIYEQCCLPSKMKEWSTRSVIFAIDLYEDLIAYLLLTCAAYVPLACCWMSDDVHAFRSTSKMKELS